VSFLPSRRIRRIFQAAVLVSLVAGAVAFSQADKSVTLSVDGKDSAVRLFGSTVGDVLANQKITSDPTRRRPGGLLADQRRLEGRREVRPSAHGHRRWTGEGVLDDLDHGRRRPVRARHPCRLREAVGLPVAAAWAQGHDHVGDDSQGCHRRRRWQDDEGTNHRRTVADLLSELKVTLGARDRVAPALTAPTHQ